MAAAAPSIRPAAAGDARHMAALWHRHLTATADKLDRGFAPARGEAQTARDWAARLRSGALAGWIAECDGEFAGYLTCRVRGRDPVFGSQFRGGRTLYVADVDIVERYRGRGLSRLLLAQAEAHARALGIDTLELAVVAADRAAAAIWSRQGFRPRVVLMRRAVGG